MSQACRVGQASPDHDVRDCWGGESGERLGERSGRGIGCGIVVPVSHVVSHVGEGRKNESNITELSIAWQSQNRKSCRSPGALER
jgi:hypothetical protein